MLDNCVDLAGCERILGKYINDITYLGQIGITEEDVTKLGEFIGIKMRDGIGAGTEFLQVYAPNCFFFFLVGQGIWNYNDGNYWSAVYDSIGFDLDINWQVKWGQIFLEFLNQKKLPCFDIKGARHYVTPILMYGGIPQDCLENYIKHVVLPMVEQDISDTEEIKDELQFFREQESRKLNIQQEIKKLNKEKAELQRQVEDLALLIQLNKEAVELTQKIGDKGSWLDLPDSFFQFQVTKLNDVKKIDSEIGKLQSQREASQKALEDLCQEEIFLVQLAEIAREYKEKETAIKQQEIEISKIIKEESSNFSKLSTIAKEIWSDGWHDGYGKSLENMDFEWLNEKLLQYENIKRCYGYLVFSSSVLLSLGYYSCNLGEISEKEYINKQKIFDRELKAIGYKPTDKEEFIKGSRFIQDQYQNKSLIIRLKQNLKEILDIKKEMEQVQADLCLFFKGLPFPEMITIGRELEIIDKLESLYEAYCFYKDNKYIRAEKQLQLSQLKLDSENTIKELAAAVDSVYEPIVLDDVILDLSTKLDDVLEKRYEAEKAKNQVEIDVGIRLPELYKNKEQVLNEIREIENRLLILGEGDLEKGITKLEYKRKAYYRLQELERQIEDLVDLISIEGTVLQDEEKLIQIYEEKGEELSQKQRKIKRQEEEFKKCHTMFSGVDEPVYRFLYYGGNSAEKWLISTIGFIIRGLTKETSPEDITNGLPTRVVTWLRDWLNNVSSNDSRCLSPFRIGQERFTNPILMLNPVYGDFKLLIGPQRFLVYGEKVPEKVAFHIITETDITSERIIEVKTYRSSYRKDIIETSTTELHLSTIASSYKINFIVDDEIRRYWEISGMHDSSPYMVFSEEGKKLDVREIPKQRLWFYVPLNYSFIPAEPIIEETVLPQRADDYQLLLIDLKDIDSLILEAPQGKRYSLVLQGLTVPVINGGKIKDGISCDGIEIYEEAPDTMFIPMKEINDLGKWEIVIKHGFQTVNERWSYRLNELDTVSFNAEDSRADILLNDSKLIGSNPVGWYFIRLRGPGRERYHFTIAVIPDLDYEFECPIYLPTLRNQQNIKLTVIVPEKAEFNVFPPAKIIEIEDDVREIEIRRQENFIAGELNMQLPDGANELLPIIFEIPKMKWRLQDPTGNDYSKWYDQVEEIWFGDWQESKELNLQMRFPIKASKYVEVYLKNREQIMSSTVRNSEAQFNLLNFTDSLKDGTSMHTLGVKVYKSGRKPMAKGDMVKIRCKWEVEKIRVNQHTHNNKRILQVKWDEKGRAKGRVLRLWRTWEPWITPLSWDIKDGVNEITLKVEKDCVPAGRYLIQFEVEDPWASEIVDVVFPEDGLNTTKILIDDGKPDLRDISIKWDNDKRVIVTGRLTHITKGKKVTVLLMGVMRGTVIAWAGSAFNKKDGRFAVTIQGRPIMANENQKTSKAVPKEWAHWLGIIVKSEPSICGFYILNEAAPLEWQIIDKNELVQMPIEASSFVFEANYDDKYHVHSVLESDNARRVLNAWRSEDFAKIKTQEGNIEFFGKEGVAQITVRGAVMCNDPNCKKRGQLLPSFNVWYTEHNGCKNCVSFLKPIKGQFFWRWDAGSIERICRDKYKLGEENNIL